MNNPENNPTNSLFDFEKQSLEKHPNFFIVGAAKSGTTSLWMYLKQHPEIHMPSTLETKEPSFFCNLYGYRDFEAYLRLFSESQKEKAIGEASHAYLTSPESADWIRKVYPEAKIIIILRNPIERSYSLYNWMIREGYEWIYPFEKALIKEKDRLKNTHFKNDNPQYYYNYLYFTSGLYSEQVKRYLNAFPQKQILILLFEDLTADPIAVIQRIYDFLGVDCDFIPKIKIHNKTKIPFSAPIQYFTKQKLLLYLEKLRVPSSYRIWRAAFNSNLFLGRFRSTVLNTTTRYNLQERYKDDIQKTARAIDRNLKLWLMDGQNNEFY